ncbi:MAG: hypothetical protein ACFFF4_14390 [Candidatus Thorarchaeota archaeon]
MKTETAQRILWFAIIFIALTTIVTLLGGIMLYFAFAYVDVGSFITDPTALAFFQDYVWVIPIAVIGLGILQLIYLFIIYLWRKDPMAHRTGLTIVGILNLLTGFNLTGLLILLPGLLLEDQ